MGLGAELPSLTSLGLETYSQGGRGSAQRPRLASFGCGTVLVAKAAVCPPREGAAMAVIPLVSAWISSSELAFGSALPTFLFCNLTFLLGHILFVFYAYFLSPHRPHGSCRHLTPGLVLNNNSCLLAE